LHSVRPNRGARRQPQNFPARRFREKMARFNGHISGSRPSSAAFMTIPVMSPARELKAMIILLFIAAIFTGLFKSDFTVKNSK